MRGLCALENRAACLPYVPPKAGVLPGTQLLPSGAAVPPTPAPAVGLGQPPLGDRSDAPRKATYPHVCTNRLLSPFCHFKDQKEKRKMASALC